MGITVAFCTAIFIISIIVAIIVTIIAVTYTHLDVYKRQVKIRKLQYLGDLMRNEQRFYLLQSILQGKVLGKRGVGQP